MTTSRPPFPLSPPSSSVRPPVLPSDVRSRPQQDRVPPQPHNRLLSLRSRLEAIDTQVDLASRYCDALLKDPNILHEGDVERDVRHVRARLEGLHRQVRESVAAMSHLAGGNGRKA